MYAGALLRCLVKTRRQKATENVVQTGSWEYPRKMGTCCFWNRQAQPKGTKSGRKSTKSGKSGTKSGKRGTKSCKKKPTVNFAERKGIRYSVPSVFCTLNVSPSLLANVSFLLFSFLFFLCRMDVSFLPANVFFFSFYIYIFFYKKNIVSPFFLFFVSFFFLLSSFMFLLSKWT